MLLTAREHSQGPRPPTAMVKTNMFQLTFKIPSGKHTLFRYHVQFFPAKRVYLKDANGEDVLDEQQRKVFGEGFIKSSKELTMKKRIDSSDNEDIDLSDSEMLKASFVTRRCCFKLQSNLLAADLPPEERRFLITDGTAVAFAPEQLFDHAAFQQPTGDQAGEESGKASNGNQPKSVAPFKEWHVSVKRSCEEDDPDGKYSVLFRA
jgi:hypothetical protein